MKEGLVYGYWLQGENAGKPVDISDDFVLDEKCQGLWLHFDYTYPPLRQWLENNTPLDEVVISSLLSAETRPRATNIHGGMLAALRGVNLSPGSDPEDMVSIRFWATENFIISTRKRPLLSVQDIAKSIEQGAGPTSIGEMIAELTGRLTERMRDTIQSTEDRIDEIEEKMLDSDSVSLREDIAKLRREAVSLRRYLSPQREAMLQMQADKYTFFSDEDRIKVREHADHLYRYVEDLDLVRERAAVTQEELAARLAEQMNNRMYVLSLVAMVFLPLGFLTGLLGVNVGGIPGTESNFAFAFVCFLMFAIAAVQIWMLRKSRWF